MSDDTGRIHISSPSGEQPSLQSIRDQAADQGIEIPENAIVLDPREMHIIMVHAALTKNIKERLNDEEQSNIKMGKEILKELVKTDAGRVALQLFSLEFDNTESPFGDRFKNMVQVGWEEALELWKQGE